MGLTGTLYVRVDPELHARITECAAAQDMSAAAWARRAVREWLAAQCPVEPDPEEARK